MSSKRRIRPFSQRDRVLYRLVPAGTEFLWRGIFWVKVDGGCRLKSGKERVTFPIPSAKNRVIVSRSSGVAHRVASAGGPRASGDYFRDAGHYDRIPKHEEDGISQ